MGIRTSITAAVITAEPMGQNVTRCTEAPTRQISIDNGFQVDLCMNCHREIQDNITEWAQKQNRIWRKFFQIKYERELMREGLSPERAREAWISLIGRSYL